MKIIVQKFGGTSVASEEARVAVKTRYSRLSVTVTPR